MSSDARPNPDDLLLAIDAEELAKKNARLRIFLGMSAGVGKTYAMLKAAHQRKAEGFNIVIGVVETHGRAETMALLEGLPVIGRKKIEYKGATLEELDIDAILALKPEIVVVDELAHSNVPGSRHTKRYQDVLELLDAGIDVYTAVNVQHLESRKEAVEAITQITIRETVPDSILERAGQVELVDIAPVELLKRLSEGKVYLGERAELAAKNFFKEDRLTALREIALRLTAERVDQDLQRFSTVQQFKSPWQTNERLMVAVSHSPYSEKLIRATRRLAYNLEAPWIAVHIDTGIHLNNEDQTQLAKNVNLARELKAEVISTTEVDVASALQRIARQKNVTQILVGRPARRWLQERLGRPTLLDRLVRESREFDVHVIRQDGLPAFAPTAVLNLNLISFSSKPVQYWNTLWLMAAVSFGSGFLDSYIGYRAVGFVFLLAVLIVGMLASIGPVVLAAFLAMLSWIYFFIPPKLTFLIQQPEDVIMAMTFIIVALITGYLTHRLRFHERLTRDREERTNVLYEVLQDISSSRDKEEFLLKVVSRVGSLLKADCGVFLATREGELKFRFEKPYALALNEKAQAVASWAFQSLKPAGWSTDTLSEADALYLPLKGPSENVGIFALRPRDARRLSVEQENLLYSITRHLAISLERHFFERRLQESRRLEESEKLHQTLLNSISHELRTPLTAIIASASALEDEVLIQDPKSVRAIAGQLGDAGDRLNRVIENLLDMSRLDSGVLEMKLEWHDVSDLVGVTLQKTLKALGGRNIETLLPAQLPMIKIDFRFMEHALSNLLVNAATYTPAHAPIRILAEASDQSLRLIVEDEGPGVPEASRDLIFNKFYRVPGTPAGGTGLGLSIVKSIVEAHGGSIAIGPTLESHDPAAHAGAKFVITLPASDKPPLAPVESR